MFIFSANTSLTEVLLVSIACKNIWFW